MFVIGLTGSMGMGKSTTASLFRENGIPVYDADAMVHELYQSTAVTPIGEIFPDVIVDRVVSRPKLKEHFKENPDDIQKLEQIIHPLVRQAQAGWMADQEAAGTTVVVLDIPLLFETGGDRFCDHVVVVSTSPDIQLSRILARGTMTKAQISHILSRQMSDADKRAQANSIIDTSLSIDDAKRQVTDLLQRLESQEPSGKWREIIS